MPATEWSVAIALLADGL